MDIRVLVAALSDPLGAPNVISISDDSSTGANGRTAGIQLNENGSLAKYVADVLITSGYWLAPQTNMGDYEVYFSLSSGDSPTGGSTLDTWLSLDVPRSVTLESIVVDETLTCTILAQIRWTTDSVVQDSATYTLTANGPLV